jgi:putative ABC transport system ATP-binding protein
VRPDRAKHLLERVGLGHRFHHRPAQLSVGEQQRVAVARALGNQPSLLLADEPTANIDTRHQQQVVDLIRETCREEKVSLMLVTHTPQVAEQFERVENLEEINRLTREDKAGSGRPAAAGKLQAEVPR